MHRPQRFIMLSSFCASLSACYVVPVQSPSSTPEAPKYEYVITPQLPQPQVAPPAPAPAPRRTLTARLYPVNDTASSIGMLSGTISNPEKGRGEFSVAIDGEFYQGEATRDLNSSKGTANASGGRGGYLKCEYTMTGQMLGAGVCKLSNGARFDMHIAH